MRKTALQNTIRERNPVLSTVTVLVMVLAVLCCVLPFLYIFAMSFSSNAAILNNRVSLWPVDFNIQAYRSVFDYPNFFTAYGYTLLYTIGGTFISLAMMTVFAYPLSKEWLKGQRFVMKMIVF